MRALEQHCGAVQALGPVKLRLEFAVRVAARLIRALTGKRYDYTRNPWVSQRYGKVFTERLRGSRYDLIYASSASTELAYVQTQTPIIYLADATFANVVDYYPACRNLLNISKRHGCLLERQSIEKSSLVLYPSEWAAQSAMSDFRAASSKIHVIPFGANLDTAPPAGMVLNKQRSEVCRLLFLGVEWIRKGGDLAFQTFLELKKRGIKSKLTVCGCTPPAGISDPDLIVTGFLNKNVAQERERIESLLLNSDFLILPTRAECTPIVFCEASAFGLPSVATDTGGVRGVVRDGVNGFLLPITAGPAEYASTIMQVFQDESSYRALVRSARAEYESRLNWDAWGTAVSDIIQKHLFPEQRPI
jgi:glycosyltransferase involved in cell wall biosynthesis